MNVRHTSSVKPATEISAAWKSIVTMKKKFGFNQAEILTLMGNMPKATYYKGVNDRATALNRDQLDRVSFILGIYKALRILFTDTKQAMTWIDRENTLAPFNGAKPREFMLEGSMLHLAEVRRFLDFWRGY